MPSNHAATPPLDPTFLTYTPQLADAYASGRSTYPPALYAHILTQHAHTGGGFSLLLDVGCGPGNAVRDLATMFADAVGVDGSVEMVNAARREGGVAGSGRRIRFAVGDAEGVDGVVREGSVDLIVAAMAAHWFDMSVFWAKAAKLLRPGGTVALWTVSSLYCRMSGCTEDALQHLMPPSFRLTWSVSNTCITDPSTPNAATIQNILFDLERDILAPYELPPNRVSRDMYDNLGLPWTVDPPVADFPAASFVRKEWNRDGKVNLDTNGNYEDFFAGTKKQALEDLEASLNTASMVTRWREANRQKAGTDNDCVKLTIERLKRALGDGEALTTGGATALLMFKKRAD